MNFVKGIILSVLISLAIAFIFGTSGSFFGGGFTIIGAESWFYLAIIIPFIINFVFVYNYFKNKELTKKNIWIISSFSALFVSLFTGTIGAIIGEAIVRGEIASIVVGDTLIWGTIYSLILLPITIPLARILNGVLLKSSLKKAIN